MTNRHIFRMTYYKNIEHFLRDGAVYAKNFRAQPQYAISYDEINNKRGSVFKTPDGETLHDFVPFYFSPITSMAFTIDRGNVPLRDPEGNDQGIADLNDVVYIVSSAETCANAGNPITFTNVACNTQSPLPEYKKDLSELDTHVNWAVFNEHPINAKITEIGYSGVCSWFHDRDNNVHRNRSAERMAEFMVKDALPLNLVECIITKHEHIKKQIDTWMQAYGQNIPVYVKTGCYF